MEVNASAQKVFRVGDRIQGIDKSSGEYVSGKISSRAGKSTGKHKNCFNLKLDSDGSVQWYDFDKIDDLRNVPDSAEMIVMFNNDKVTEAKEKEIANWRENDVFEEVPDEGQKKLSVRWVITEKVKSDERIIKARLVVRGFEEDSIDIQKDSPTCSREALRLSISIASSKGWAVQSIDVKAAYLQGKSINRDLYVWPPPEYNNGNIWKLRKTVYGLVDAARAWYTTVKETLLGLNMKMCALDQSLFYMQREGKLIGLICIHVDDFFWCGETIFEQLVMNKFTAHFSIGSTCASKFKYLGLNIDSTEQGVLVNQNQYASTLKCVPISQFRAGNKSKELTEKEKDEYRALIGQLNWLAIQTRPDVSFETCELHTLLKNATVSELTRLNRLINRTKSSSLSILFPKLTSLENCFIEAFSDASYANVQNGKSQGGFIIFLVDDEDKRCPIYWQSRAIRRVVKSTLAAETLALVECAETAVYIGMIIQELTTNKLRIKCKVDNKSLVDSIHSAKDVDDRRLRVDIAVLRDMLLRQELHEVSWVPTRQQLADPLTKRGACTKQLCAALRQD